MVESNYSSPLVSVCIPMYNVSEYIEETLQKILKQSYQNIEVVIVDDHSTDDSYQKAQKFESKKVKVFKNKKKGGNAARNLAFEKSSGDYIKFMDSDDYCSETMIERQLERMLKDGTEETLIHSPLKMLEPDGRIYSLPRFIDQDFVPGIELLVAIWNQEGWNVPHCHLMHRHLIVKSGGWDETVLKNQDAEFFARVAAVADMALSVDDVFAIWRQTKKGVSTQISVKAFATVIDTFEIIIRLLLNYKDTPEMREICSKYVGVYVFTNYPLIKPLMPRINRMLTKNGIKLILPDRKALNVLRWLFGWKLSIRIIKALNL
ncbi:glycosyltransferase family 2 protein [Litoribaculum gwangyangense]|uniref:Glycosyltransferase 2-like domain-containing protein n=1 Tax=Litoribaculum gwangyangense TaxID=1130722 RepID=A0ABP9CSM9_9FLAO